MIPVLLFATAFLVRALVGMLFQGPAYPDSYYYVNVARELAEGNGFQVDYIWNFVDVGGRLPADPSLPIPSNGHWMPLASLVMVPFIWLLGATPLAFGLPFWIAGALAAPLTWAIGRDAGLGDRASIGGALLVAVPGGMTPFLSQPDNFGLFMPLGALAMWLCARSIRGDRRAFVIGGLVVGLATLARNDGVLLGVPFALVAATDLLRRRGSARIGLVAAVGCAALFALVMAPWLARQLAVFGTISPSADSGRILWITDYGQLHSIAGDRPSLGTLLSQGAGPLLASRVGGLVAAIGLFALLPLVAVLAPLALIGAWHERGSRAFSPFFVYAAALFIMSALLFAIHVPFGTFIHSASALLPHTYLLVVVGVGAVVGWVARRRPRWDARTAARFFTAGAVAIAVLLAGLQTARTTTRWEEARAPREELALTLRTTPPADLVMSADPGAYRHIAGRGGIVTPNDPLPVVEGALRAYGIRWLALESGQIVTSLQPVLLGEVAPSWLSSPVATVMGASGETIAALYAVCLTPDDQRCRP
jgi:hypothetical protein